MSLAGCYIAAAPLPLRRSCRVHNNREVQEAEYSCYSTALLCATPALRLGLAVQDDLHHWCSTVCLGGVEEFR